MHKLSSSKSFDFLVSSFLAYVFLYLWVSFSFFFTEYNEYIEYNKAYGWRVTESKNLAIQSNIEDFDLNISFFI